MGAASNSGVTGQGTGYGGTHTGNNLGTSTGATGGLSNSTNAGPHDVSFVKFFHDTTWSIKGPPAYSYIHSTVTLLSRFSSQTLRTRWIPVWILILMAEETAVVQQQEELWEHQVPMPPQDQALLKTQLVLITAIS